MANLLIVDDEKSVRFTLQQFLLGEGHHVDVAQDAREAQQLVAERMYDVVVTDIILPGLSGVDLLKIIHQTAPRVQVIMMTAEPTIATAAEAVRNGASDYLTKPVQKKDMIRCVTTALRIKALDDERQHEQESRERYQRELQSSLTQLKETNAQLLEAATFREEVEQLTRHDLKSPLSIVIGAPALIRMLLGKLTEEQDEWLKKIESAGHRMLDMINRSLDLFKMEQGLYVLHMKGVDLVNIAKEVISQNATIISNKNLAVVMTVDDHPATKADVFMVQGEGLLCYSMLGNLLKNALEASPTGESVTIRFVSGEQMEMHLRNRGAVPESIRDRFFQKFSTAGKPHGTGLGTYSARLIAELHGARISVDTSVPDFTTVAIGFPRHPAVNSKECAV